MSLLEGKVAVITGAGSGMAKASTMVFIREGAKVLAADISGAEQDTAAEAGDAVVPFHADVTKESDVEAMIGQAVSEFGRIDVLCNVAGIGTGGLIADVTMEDYDRTLDVDLRGVLLGMKHAIPAMLETGGGSIVNWSSIGGLNASPGTGVYSAAKAGVIAVTKAAAVEYGSKGIRANALCPGFILTEIMGAAGLETYQGITKKAALRRAGEPHEVAEVAAFLASDRASFVTGAIIPVDGGWIAQVACEGSSEMTTTTGTDVSYDPYDVEINADPYPVFRRLREEAPLYRNDTYDFYALSRFDDVERGLANRETYISGRGAILELIKADMEMPPGVIIFEDPPVHTMHRGLLSRVFTPKKMHALEPQIRDFCARSLDPLVGAGGFDFVRDLGAQMPMRVIGMLLGIPDQDQEAIRDRVDADLRTEPGKPMQVSQDQLVTGAAFAEYVDWRADHPSDDLMTQLLQAEFEDETGTTRRLTREEVLTYVNVVAGAGNETTTRLIGWAGTVLADHPDQRRQLVEDRSLIPNAIEELLRYEPPAPHVARYVSRDVEHHGQTVPEGSVMMFLVGAANRDDRRFPDGDRFDIRRDVGQHLTFGYGIHFCLGAALARLEGRIALDEVLQRFPEWEVDLDNARLSPTSTVRGWETLPVRVP